MLRRVCSFLVSCAILLSLCCFVFFTGCSSNHNSSTTTPPGSGGSGGTGAGSGGGGTGGGGSGSGGGGTGSGGGGTGSGGGSGSGGSSGSGSGSAAEYLYMAASGQQGSVYEYKIDPTTGALTPLSGSPFMANVGNPTVVCTTGCGASLVADPLGRFLFYQFNYGSTASDGVDSLNVSATDGTLSSNSQILQSVYEPATDPQGRFIYWNASGSGNAIGGLDVASSGQLTTAPGQPYTFNGQTSYQPPAVSANYVFATNYRDTASASGQGELVEWTIDSATGALTQTSNTLPLQYAAGAVVTPNGKFAYTQQQYQSNGTAYYEIVPVQIGTNGALTELTQNVQQTTSQGIDMIWMSPNGNFLYMGINGTDLWDYQIDQTTGALTLLQKYTSINEGDTLAIDPSARYMFTAPAGANHVAGTTIAVYSVDSTTGALTPLPNDTVDTKVLPISLAVVAPQ